jgi:hypothetical protein
MHTTLESFATKKSVVGQMVRVISKTEKHMVFDDFEQKLTWYGAVVSMSTTQVVISAIADPFWGGVIDAEAGVNLTFSMSDVDVEFTSIGLSF